GFFLAAIAKRPVRRIFEKQEPVGGGELGDSASLRSRAGRTGRVLEVRNDVEELQHVRRERPLERLEIRTVGLERDAHDLRPVTTKERERAVVGRRLREDDVAGPQHVQAEELDEL